MELNGQYKVSVVTVCRNNLEGLQRTYRSLRDQGDNDIEWLVIDGASTDGTPEWLKACAYDRLRFVSEPDKGIFDAMNKGTRLAQGDWVLFLNAGDGFCERGALPKVMGVLQDGYDIVAGSTVFFSIYGTRVCRAKPLDTVKQGMPFCHQSVFVKRELLLRHPYNVRFTLAADYEFFYWAVEQQVVDCIVGYPIALFDGRCSVSERQALEVQRQYRQIQGRYRGFMNQLRWKGFVGWQAVKSVIKWFIPHAIIRARRQRYYTTDC